MVRHRGDEDGDVSESAAEAEPSAPSDEAVVSPASTSVESTFYMAVLVAEAARQSAYASAWATWLANATAANKAAFVAAIAAADVAYFTAVNTARNTSGLTLKTIGNGGPIPWSYAAGMS
jgi:hypothetical protein